MKNKMITMASIFGILLVFGATSAMAQNMNNGNTGDMQNHKCSMLEGLVAFRFFFNRIIVNR